jgi:hypothetical protein
MKLTATMFLSLDGVYQGPGEPDEDRRGGFDRGGWAEPTFDDETGQYMTIRIRAHRSAAARTQDLGDLRGVLAASRHG